MLLSVNSIAAEDSSVEAYGSLRLQGEHVSVDDAIAGEDDSYNGLRDAYSRFGVKASTDLGNGVALSAKLEIPFNMAKLRLEDPTFFQGFYKGNSDPRLYKISLTNEEYGSLSFGRQWLAYYNNIAYPVDYFSSFYSGFATHAIFRREALTYISPAFSGMKATISGVDLTAGDGTDYLDTMQYAFSYTGDALSMAIAYQDAHDDRADLLGISASYTTGPWRFAAKVEQLQSNSNVTENKDPLVYNLYGSYTMNKYTFKAMYANGDGNEDKNDEVDAFFIGDSYQLGVDYQYNESLMFFIDYFFEENSYAVYTPDSSSYETLAPYQSHSDGRAVSVGIRFDF